MFQKPFEEVFNAEILIEIEEIEVKVKGVDILNLIENPVSTLNYKVFPVLQGDLLEDGWIYPDSYNKKDGRFIKGIYGGNKWGGKFLRAPDIFFKILKIGKGKLVKL